MSIRVRLDTSSINTQHQSGVASYTKLLEEALSSDTDIDLQAVVRPPLALRLYAKLQSHRLAPPYDLFLPATDLTIFPNFATLPTIKSKKVATVIHDLTYVRFPESVESANLRHLKRVVPRSIRQSDFIITVSQSIKNEIVKEFSVNPKKIIVTPISPSREFYEKTNSSVREKYKIPTAKYIYFIGNLEPRKNLVTLIKAYRLLPAGVKDEYSLVIAGAKGWNTKETDAELAKAKLADENIIQIGFIDQTDSPALYQNADIFVMPSLYEGFGIPVLEAMASKTPVVCSDIPVLREVGGDACLYASTLSPEDFSRQIESILNDTALKDKLVTKGLDNLKAFNWTDNVRLIKSIVTRD